MMINLIAKASGMHKEIIAIILVQNVVPLAVLPILELAKLF